MDAPLPECLECVISPVRGTTQIARRGINDPHVLQAMRRVPREAFVDPGFEEFAYEDSPLSIGEGQTISQPYIVAR